MDLRLHFLESFMAKGSDGAQYKVMAYERMTPDVPFTHAAQAWEPTGMTEYHLEDGRLVDVRRDGSMHIQNSSVQLVPQDARH